jgi:hypothetical protein
MQALLESFGYEPGVEPLLRPVCYTSQDIRRMYKDAEAKEIKYKKCLNCCNGFWGSRAVHFCGPDCQYSYLVRGEGRDEDDDEDESDAQEEAKVDQARPGRSKSVRQSGPSPSIPVPKSCKV